MFHPKDLAEPIVQAPLAGGPSTPELAIAVCKAGGLGFVAAGYKTADATAEQIDVVAAATSRPFGVNVFVPSREPADPDAVSAYLEELEAEALLQGADVGEPRFEDDDWERKLGVICERGVAVASFVFGCPEPAVVARLQNAGVAVWVTVTDPGEAEQARDAGADALVVQGSEAGGHRGGFDDRDSAGGTGLLALLRIVGASVPLPLVAAGGIPDGAAVAAVLCAGASAAQVGTALMLAPEAGTHDSQRALLADRAPTQLTRAFTGRLGRGIVNRFLEQRDDRPLPARTRRSTTRPARSGPPPANAGTPGRSICGPARPTSWRRAAPRGRSSARWGRTVGGCCANSTSASADAPFTGAAGRVGRTRRHARC